MDRRPQTINVGGVLVKFRKSVSSLPFRKITIKYPSGLDATCTDGQTLQHETRRYIYSTGQINFYTITKHAEKAKSILERLNMKTFVTDIHNNKHEVIEKTS